MSMTIVGAIDELREEVLRRRKLRPLRELAQDMDLVYGTLLRFLHNDRPTRIKTIHKVDQWVRQQQAEEARCSC